MAANILHSSETSEWYTPDYILEWARYILGGMINLDPCSCYAANKHVMAENFFNFDKRFPAVIANENYKSIYGTFANGLEQDWKCLRLWHNPPYSKDDGGPADKWVTKLIHEHLLVRNMGSGMSILNSTPDREFFKKLWNYPIAFLKDRVPFIDAFGNKGEQPSHGSVLVLHPAEGNEGICQYLRFCETLRDHAHIVPPLFHGNSSSVPSIVGRWDIGKK